MTDPLDLVAHTATELAQGEATIAELRRDRDRAIYQALDASRYQSLIAERAGVSPQFISKLARQRGKDEVLTEQHALGEAGPWAAWYAEYVDEDAPLKDWHRHSQPFSPAELQEILDQVTDIRTEDKQWADSPASFHQ